MTRLHSEWQRLYLTPGDSLITPDGQVRAMVLALARPADWSALSAAWQGVQLDLGLPAPAIAVSGLDAYQLWFSLAEPLPVAQAHAFLDAVRARYLGHIDATRISLLPATDAQVPPQARHADMVPLQQGQTDQWSAFVAPDLAPMFAETPWLDMPPSPEGQAELLSRLTSIQHTDWRTALQRLQPTQTAALKSSTHADTTGPGLNPHRFLHQVMNDDTVALALRIEAAKALLPYTPPCP